MQMGIMRRAIPSSVPRPNRGTNRRRIAAGFGPVWSGFSKDKTGRSARSTQMRRLMGDAAFFWWKRMGFARIQKTMSFFVRPRNRHQRSA